MRFLVFQHVAAEHPGSLRDLMRADGVVWDTVELDEGEAIPPLDGYDALLVFGGPMDVWQEAEHPWLVPEKAAIRAWTAQDRPYLGVCLGHQLLADALGGRVGLMAAPEVGVREIELTAAGRAPPLLAGLPSPCPTLQLVLGLLIPLFLIGTLIMFVLDRSGGNPFFLEETVRTLVETGALAGQRGHYRLAQPIQAIQVGRRAFGIQYHVELTEETVPEWGIIPEYRCALEAITGPGGQAELELATRERMPEFRANAARLYRNFIEVCRTP